MPRIITLTFRKISGILDTTGLSTGNTADVALNVYCPECGTKGKCFLIGTRQQDGAIYEFAAEFQGTTDMRTRLIILLNLIIITVCLAVLVVMVQST